MGACQLPPTTLEFTRLGRTTTVQLPYVFTRPGTHTITVTVTSGGCGRPLTTVTKTLRIVVRGGGTTHIAQTPATTCRGAARPITKKTLRAARATILCLTNELRKRKKRKPLRSSATLSRSALTHTRDMVRRRYFAHEGSGGPDLRRRLRTAGYRGAAAGENIAFASGATPAEVMQMWVNSPPHYANILYPGYRFMGTGIVIGAAPLAGAGRGVSFGVNFGSSRR